MAFSHSHLCIIYIELIELVRHNGGMRGGFGALGWYHVVAGSRPKGFGLPVRHAVSGFMVFMDGFDFSGGIVVSDWVSWGVDL